MTHADRLVGMELDLRRFVRVLFKRKWYVLVGFLAAMAVGSFITVNATPIYQAQSTLFVGERQIAIEELRSAVEVSNLSARLLQSYAQILQSRTMAQRAVVEGGLDITPGEIRAGLTAEAVVDTQVIRLSYRGTDAAIAERAVNAVAKAFVSEIVRLESPQESGQEPAVRVSIIDPAVAPSVPIDPNPLRNMSLAVVLGLVLGGGLAFFVDYLDQSVKSREELENMGIPVVGAVPELDTHGEDVYLERDNQGMGGEAFRKLRTSIGFLGVEKPIKTVLVTSPIAQEGKTTLALNLASAYAVGGFRTLLVEADLRRPSLHKIFGMYGTRGLTTVIVGGVPLSEAIVHTETRNLAVLLAGAIPPNPVELLGSEQMTDVLGQLGLMFDVVIVDSPPLVPVADPAALAARCDGVLIVARAGKTDRRRLIDSVQIIERASGRLLGVALNFLRAGDSAYDYGYYYGYRTTQPSLAREGRS